MSASSCPVRWAIPRPDPDKPNQGYPLLECVEHVELYHATPEHGLYCHHAHVAHHHGTFFAIWSSHPHGEDGPGQRVHYARSKDGRQWTPFGLCFPSMGPVCEPGTSGGRVLTANGLAPIGDRVYAMGEVDEKFVDEPERQRAIESARGRQTRRDRFGWGRVARAMGADGSLGPIFWLVPDPPEPLPGFQAYPASSGRLYGRVAQSIGERLADPLHMCAWDFRCHTNWTTAADGHELCEPTVYRRPDGLLVKLSRDLRHSRRLYAALSEDQGRAWQAAVQTAIPDSPSKSIAGTLPDGRTYLIGNQVETGRRDPLTIALSRDGVTFDWAAAIRSGCPAVRVKGRAKGPGFQYPSAVVVGDALWVVYSIGKEDVALSRVPLASLPPVG